MNLRRYFGWIMACVGAALFVIWQGWQRSQPTVVQVAAAKTAPLVAEWSAVGYVEARTARVTAPQVGRVERVLVREGDRVRAGQLLATLARRSEEAGVVAQQAGVNVARAQADAAQAAHSEAEASQGDRERRAAAETVSARERWRQAAAMLTRSRRMVPAHVEAARAEMEAAQATLRDLERGSRPEEIAQAQAELTAAEATLRRTRTEFERQTQLYKEGAAAKTAVEDAEEAQIRAESAAKARREALALLKRGTREEQITAARARLRSAEAGLRAAEGDMEGLVAEAGKVTEAAAALRAAKAAEAETRSARARLETLRQEARAAEARIGQSRATANQAAAELTERAVFAPYDGVVGRRYVDPGDMASPTQALFSIVEANEVWVSAEVDEQDLAPVREGQPVVVTAPAYVGREFAGTVLRIGGEAVPQTEVRTGARIVRVRVSLESTPPRERALLKPGMEVHASGKATLAVQAILIPSDSLLTDDEGSYVWMVENHQTRRHRVRAGYINGRETEVVSGLRAGEKVVVSGKESLKEGQAVEAKSAALESRLR
jgi:HlyD family secretion protein